MISKIKIESKIYFKNANKLKLINKKAKKDLN